VVQTHLLLPDTHESCFCLACIASGPHLGCCQLYCLLLLLQAQARYGNNWKAISMLLPGRTNRAVKNLFVGNLKWGARLPEIRNRCAVLYPLTCAFRSLQHNTLVLRSG
jgi:hypothetical protein